ncbi:hypothetical protein DPMN_117799, partial [Dreissena polymorpha]
DRQCRLLVSMKRRRTSFFSFQRQFMWLMLMLVDLHVHVMVFQFWNLFRVLLLFLIGILLVIFRNLERTR